MHSGKGRLFLAVAAVVAVTGSSVVPALAWGQHDHVYADSFGNLVIESAAGYKRILVGEGKMAKELSRYTSAGETGDVAERDASDARDGGDCYRPPVFVKGRSYMYGLSDGEMPELSPCR
jgi:hypothetical protein